MPDRPDTPDRTPDKLQDAVEQTVPGEQFSPEGLKRQLEGTALDQTPDETAEQYLRKTVTDTDGQGTRGDSRALTSIGDSAPVPAELLDDDTDEQDVGKRFVLQGEAGAGATSRVFAFRDRSLDRVVAVKMLRGSRLAKRNVRARFIHEARVTAKLEHPNIMPVHDVGTTEGRGLYFVMKRAEGVTLGEAIRAARSGETTSEEFTNTDGKVRIFLKLLDAVAFAHSRGYIHQDIKPDNVMLGDYGEVLLLDWGSAVSREEAHTLTGKALYGTPAFMSPEQARRDHVDERSDIYCLGSSLFQALLLRHPMFEESPDTYWERKREGNIDQPSDDERRTVPGALLDIALKAMEPDPDDRYQTVSEFADELKRYQAGQAVKAHRESLFEWCGRWYRHNRRLFWAIAGGVLAVGFVGGVLFREKLKEMLTWKLVYAENFEQVTTRELNAHWEAQGFTNWVDRRPDSLVDSGGAWQVVDGALHGRANRGAWELVYRQPVNGDLRIEWDATPLTGASDLSCFVAGTDRNSSYMFHVDGFNKRNAVILTTGKATGHLQIGPHSTNFREGERYHFRMEREGRTVRLFIDGVLVIEHMDPDILSGVGHRRFGFEVSDSRRVALDNIRVFHHPQPLRVSPVAVPDAFFAEGMYVRALKEYRALRRAYPNTDVSAESWYKTARCLHRLDSLDLALETLERFVEQYPRHELVPLSIFERGQVLLSLGRAEDADSLYFELARTYHRHPLVRGVLSSLTEQALAVHDSRRDSIGLDPVADRLFIDWLDHERVRIQTLADAADLSVAYNGFLSKVAGELADIDVAGMHIDTVIGRYPQQRSAIAYQLAGWQNIGRIEREIPEQTAARASALVGMKAHLELLEAPFVTRKHRLDALLGLRRREEVIQQFAGWPDQHAYVMSVLGRADELRSMYPGSGDHIASALWNAGRLREVLDEYPMSANGLEAALHFGEVEAWHAAVVRAGAGNGPISRQIEYYTGIDYMPDSMVAYVRATRRYQTKNSYGWQAFHRLADIGRADLTVRDPEVGPLQRLTGYLYQSAFDSAMIMFPDNRGVMREKLIAFGLYDSLVRYAPECTEHVMLGLRLSGQHGDILDRFPRHRAACAQALVDAGRYDEVIEHYTDQPAQREDALLFAGHAEDLLREYPYSRDRCATALFVLGRGDEAFERYPEQRERYASWLCDQQRYDEVTERFIDCGVQFARARIAQGRARRLMEEFRRRRRRPQRLEQHAIYSLLALDAARKGRLSRAQAYLDTRPIVYPHEVEHRQRFAEHLLGPLLRAFDGDTRALDSTVALLVPPRRYHYAQCLWHEAAYLAGDIDDAAFLAQPRQVYLRENHALMSALRADLEGRHADALDHYRELQAIPLPQGLMSQVVVREVVRWRRESLSQSVKEPKSQGRGS